MKQINLTEKEASYLLYILTTGFVIGEDIEEKQYNNELKLLNNLINKVSK